MPQVRFLPSWYFNSQPHKEADFIRHAFCYQLLHFNSQPHKEADNIFDNPELIGETFQLTASQGG